MTKPTKKQMEASTRMFKEISAIVSAEADTDVIHVSLANVVSAWLISFRCADPIVEAKERGDIFKKFVEDVGYIVETNMKMTSKVGHA